MKPGVLFHFVRMTALLAVVALTALACSDSNDDTADGDDPSPDGDETESPIDGDAPRCGFGFVWNEDLERCVPDTPIDGDEDADGDMDGETPEGDDPDGDEDAPEMDAEPEGEAGPYGEYDEPSVVGPAEDAFDELCGGEDPVYGDEFEIAYDCGTRTGRLSGYDFNDEAMKFIPDQPIRIKKVRLQFSTSALPARAMDVAVRLTRDYFRSRPELDEILAPEQIRTIESDEYNTWVEFDFSADNVVVHPRDHFWVVYRHLQPQPMLNVAENCADLTHSMYRSDELIAEWRAQGQAFVWGGFDNEDNYMVRVVAEPFCERETPLFTDISAETDILGLDEAMTLDQIKENRTAFADLNADGWQDLILYTTTNQESGARVLMHNGDGTFTDTTEASGLNGHYTVFNLFGDVDNNGAVDAYGAVYTNQDDPQTQQDIILLNDGTGVFSMLPDAGVAESSTTSAAGFGDFDRDGNLDIYSGNWLLNYPQPASMTDFLFQGAGDGTFTDVTEAMGMSWLQQHTGEPCYGVTWCDWNNDGWMDILVANYGYGMNMLWKNQEGAGFVDEGGNKGLARDAFGSLGGNTFGIDCGDYNNDGNLDVYLAEIAHPRYQPDSDPSRLMKNTGSEGDFVFEDMTEELGIHHDEGEIDPTWIDFDNDGDLDLFIVSLYSLHFARLYRQEWDGTFTDITYLAGIKAHDSVANNWADLDHDGDLDLIVARRSTGAHLHLFRNDIGQDKHWAQFRLEGSAGMAPAGRDVSPSNRSAIGARITVTAGDLVQIREIKGGKGHFNQQPPLVQHFGLGDHDTIDSVHIRWPNGQEETFDSPPADTFLYSLEGTNTLVQDPQIYTEDR